jgi:hypothetical protein
MTNGSVACYQLPVSGRRANKSETPTSFSLLEIQGLVTGNW